MAQSASSRAASQNGTVTKAAVSAFACAPGPFGGGLSISPFWKSWVTRIGMPAALAFCIAGMISDSAVP